jgi:hypothetical protein
MKNKNVIIQILIDTKDWASDIQNINVNDVYSGWASQDELLAQLDYHIAEAHNETTDFTKLVTLYTPTAGLCEIVATDIASKTYINLAARFDDWYSSV